MPNAGMPMKKYTKMSIEELAEEFSKTTPGAASLTAIMIELERRAHIAQIEAAQAAKAATVAQKAAADAQKDAAEWTKCSVFWMALSAIGIFLTAFFTAAGIFD